ncbi:MAG: 5-oxoprolinase [Rhodospirillaceae bacterium]|nr:MAG: 5-oxoprolinase [Rhodospirillaceae bacterium]
MAAWQFWIDRGGTFTDIVARGPDGRLTTRKVLSENPAVPGDAAIAGMRAILEEASGLAADAPFPVHAIEVIKLGTTVATNALLERKGTPTVLAITAGHADALFIGTQHRPRLFDLNIRRPAMLYERVVEIPERVTADGKIIVELNEAITRARLTEAYAAGYRSVAIVCMHGYRYPDHEQRVARMAAEIGFSQISESHDVSPLINLIGRGDTTVADAYLSPVLRHYIAGVAEVIGGTRLMVMQSNGGLAVAAQVRGKDAVLSGPAGGVIGAAETARAAGFDKIIGFDMGGTSTDVCHVAGDYERTFDTVVAGVRLRTPMMAVHTVAAGGGSLLIFDGHRFRVGPESAGANPGPASYGNGGPLTVTDANVLLGRLQPAFFPHLFGPHGDAPLDAAMVTNKFAALEQTVAATGQHRSAHDLAEGFLAIAVDNMARAIRKITVERGHDVASYTLACFGGAGGQHACRVAEALGVRRIVIHPLAGVLSAYGIGLAPLRVIKERSLDAALDAAGLKELDGCVNALTSDAMTALMAQGVAASDIAQTRRVHLRYSGVDTAIPVPYGPVDAMTAAFTAAHQAHFGFLMLNRAIVCAMVEAEVFGGGATPVPFAVAPSSKSPQAVAHVAMVHGGMAHTTPVFDRSDLGAGQQLVGPALIAEDTATTVVEPGWAAIVGTHGDLILAHTAAPQTITNSTAPDPLRIEVFNNLFMSVAEQMGAVLQNTAQSVNIKERLDFSCAVFDGAGNLVANAPHMPVHLGSMGDSVRAVRAHHHFMKPGDSFVLNNPFAGGTHLPDITVVSPVFVEQEAVPAFFVASRGHHADVGGLTPGSMPPNSHTLAEEGVLLDGIAMVRDGRFAEDTLRAALMTGPYPARNPEQNLADLRAQAAANAKGVAELQRICAVLGRETVVAYMGYVQDHAEEAVRRVIGRLSSGALRCPMDSGGHITVRVEVDHATRGATIDFTGTAAEQHNNFNAPPSICRAAVLYVFRTLVADDIPMNEGCMRPLTLVIPENSILNPRHKEPLPAVVAGNVETSQIVCDALYGALGVLAASQGTMNNLTFGDDKHQYYETICGGAGAGPDFDGADAVQTHMTNSRLTDPEVLEHRYPVIVEKFAVRRGSGGEGRHKGGDGVVRTLRFRAPVTAAILSGRRKSHPFGMHGGHNGAVGETMAEFADGHGKLLGSTDEIQLEAGDAITVSTPGGGGFGQRGARRD